MQSAQFAIICHIPACTLRGFTSCQVFFHRQRWLVAMCHLEFGTAIFDGNFRTSPGVVALLLWASTKCEIADITDMIETEFKTIGKGSPVLEAFVRNLLKCLFPANLAWSLLASLDLASGSPATTAARSQVGQTFALAILHSRAANSFPRNSRCSSLVVLQRS